MHHEGKGQSRNDKPHPRKKKNHHSLRYHNPRNSPVPKYTQHRYSLDPTCPQTSNPNLSQAASARSTGFFHRQITHITCV